MKPLFIPLKAVYFDAFKAGAKRIEYRPYGPRWNEKTCAIGRAVTLSRGYGNQQRLSGTVESFDIMHRTQLPAEAQSGWLACYGHRNGEVACIGVKL